jgi:hypothetical protein
MVMGREVKVADDRSKFKQWLVNSGLDIDKLRPKMEEYQDILKWNTDSVSYMAARAKVIKEFYELYSTLSDKGADFQLEITKLSYFMDMLEKKLLDEGINPIENKEYMNALKRKQDLMVELSKLRLDVEKAKVDFISKKTHKNNPDDDYEFVYTGEQ